jgi:chromate reductase
LKDLFLSHQGLLLACPEYNSSMSGVLKNALDWVSRSSGKEEKSLSAYTDKVAAIMSASPGTLGGLRGLVHVRSILGNIKVLVIPDQIAVSKADQAFNADGSMKDAKLEAAVHSVAIKLVQTLGKLNA